jgi:hypothetical protein
VFAGLKSDLLAVVDVAGAVVEVDVVRQGRPQIKECMYHEPTRFGGVEESLHFCEIFDEEYQG